MSVTPADLFLGVKLDPLTASRLKFIAAEMGTSKSAFARGALAEAIAKRLRTMAVEAEHQPPSTVQPVEVASHE